MARFDGNSFGSGLLQGFSFVEGIRQAREDREYRKREEARSIEDRNLRLEDRNRALAREKNTDFSSMVDMYDADGKTYKDLDEKSQVELYGAYKNDMSPDDGTEVVGMQANGDGTMTPILRGKDKYGRQFDGKPMTKDGVPVDEGGEPLKFKVEDLDNDIKRWAAKYNPNISSRAAQRAEIRRVEKREGEDLEDGRAMAAGIAARRATESPSSESPEIAALRSQIKARVDAGDLPGASALMERLKQREQVEFTAAPSSGDGVAKARGVQFAPEETALIGKYATSPTVRTAMELAARIENRGFGRMRWDAESGAGAKGGWQFIDSTAKAYGVTDPRNPEIATKGAAAYFADLEKRYGGNIMAMLAEYNGGTKAAQAVLAGKAPPAAETQEYLSIAQGLLGDKAPQQAAAAAPAPAEAPKRGILDAVNPISTAQASPTAPAGVPETMADARGFQNQINDQIMNSGLGLISRGLTAAGQMMIDKTSEAVRTSTTSARWLSTSTKDVAANPVKHLDRWGYERGDASPEVRAQVDKNIVDATMLRVKELAPIAKGGDKKAAQELKAIEGQLRNLQFGIAAAAGVPVKARPGAELVGQMKDAPIPPPSKDAGAMKSDRAALTRASDRNSGSDAPELSQREIDAASRMYARGRITAEQYQRYLMTGFLEKGAIEQLDPTKSLIERLPDGRIRMVYDGTPAAMAEAALKAKKTSDGSVHKALLGRMDSIIEGRYKDMKNSRLTEERKNQVLGVIYQNAAVLAGLGYDIWDHEEQKFSLDNLDEIQISELTNTLLDNIERNEQPLSWFKTLTGQDQSKPAITEGLNQQVARFDEGRFQTTLENLRRAAAAGDPKAQAALERGEDYIRQKVAAAK